MILRRAIRQSFSSGQRLVPGFVLLALSACGTVKEQGTLAELQQMSPDVDEVYLDDSLQRAAESYRNYLEETPESSLTPEAMRRLADLQIEQEYGVLGGGGHIVEMRAPDTAKPLAVATAQAPVAGPDVSGESDSAFVA
jgi:hypothetical protein